MIWLGVALYVVLGALLAIEAAARIDVNTGDDHEWDRLDIVAVLMVGLLWPFALLAVAWFWGFEWRAEQLRKHPDVAG